MGDERVTILRTRANDIAGTRALAKPDMVVANKARGARMIKMIIRALAVASLFLMTPGAMAQTPGSAAPGDQSQLLKPEQLDALVSPVALYPDTLLAEVLMASTYPLEVVEAERWVQENKGLKGDQLKAAVDKQSWEDSVKSLTATPEVLDMMSKQINWTRQLGDAVLAQQADVMDAVQRLVTKPRPTTS